MGYLITGANGFIGSYVLREFLKFQNVYASRRNPKIILNVNYQENQFG